MHDPFASYNPKSICQAMGLPGFFPTSHPSDSPFILRTLFRPSFSPELCLTWRHTSSGVTLEIRTFPVQLWTHLIDRSASKPNPVICEESSFPQPLWLETLAQVQADLKTIQRTYVPIRDHAFADGMNLDLVLCSGPDQTHLHIHTSTPMKGKGFIFDLLEQAMHHTTRHECQTAIRYSGHYIGLDLPITAPPTPPNPSVPLSTLHPLLTHTPPHSRTTRAKTPFTSSPCVSVSTCPPPRTT